MIKSDIQYNITKSKIERFNKMLLNIKNRQIFLDAEKASIESQIEEMEKNIKEYKKNI